MRLLIVQFTWRVTSGEIDEYGCDSRTFQLITWSKDQHLKYWNVNPEQMQMVGHVTQPPDAFRMKQPKSPKSKRVTKKSRNDLKPPPGLEDFFEERHIKPSHDPPPQEEVSLTIGSPSGLQWEKDVVESAKLFSKVHIEKVCSN